MKTTSGKPRATNSRLEVGAAGAKVSEPRNIIGDGKALQETHKKSCTVLCRFAKNGVECGMVNDGRMVKRYFRCSKCHEYNRDFVTYFYDPGDMVPVCTNVQKVAFQTVGTLLHGAFSMMVENGGVSDESMLLVAGIKKAATEGGLLQPDEYTEKWEDHKPLQEALINCTVAVRCRDKVGFRNAFFSVFYHLIACYPADHPERRVKQKVEEEVKNP